MDLIYVDQSINEKETEILSDMLWDYHVRNIDEEYYKNKKAETYKVVKNNKTSLIIKDKKEIIGFITTSVETFKLPQDELFIHAIYIKPLYRDKLIGTKVFEELFSQAYKQGFAYIQLMVHKDNAKAIKFYKNFGFVNFNSLSKDNKTIPMLNVVNDNANPIMQHCKHIMWTFRRKLFGGSK